MKILIKCQACPTTTNWKVTLPNRSKLWNNIKNTKLLEKMFQKVDMRQATLIDVQV